ncbi:MAG: Crp/Fnr family transcriptional regulator [Bacilli bacterium]
MSSFHGPLLGEDQRSQLMERSQTYHYRKHQQVCSADETENFYFIVTSGCLRVFFTHMSADPTFSMQLIRIVGGMLRTSLHCIESLVFENLESRLAEYLLRETSDSSSETKGSITTRHEMSIEEIAKFVDGSRQSVFLLLGNWQRAGIVRHDHRRIYIEVPLRLYDIAHRTS